MSAIVTTEITDDERDDQRCLASGVLLAAHGIVKRTANRIPHRVIVVDHDHPAPAPEPSPRHNPSQPDSAPPG